MTAYTDTKRQLLLSFDVEEFDLPLEYGVGISEADQFRVGAAGLEVVLLLLERLEITATFFTTARFALHHGELIRRAALRHEIASHGVEHGRYEDAHLLQSRLILEQVAGRPVRGFRRARLQPTDHGLIQAAGYAYNSSENPTLLPGRYNNLLGPRTVYRFESLVNIPISATPMVRFPLFWLTFKNSPLDVFRAASSRVLRFDSYINVFFHSWEFVDLSAYRVPWYVKRIDGPGLVARLESYLGWLKRLGKFVTFQAFVSALGLPRALPQYGVATKANDEDAEGDVQ